MDKKIFTVLLFSLVTRVIYLFFDKNIWWDAAVYLAMGEHIATFGQLGFWEPIRPLLCPFLLSYAFLFELNPIILGHIFSTFFSLGVIYLTYFIAKKLFNEQTALLSSILLSFTWIFFLFNARLYTEIPAVFFGLCAYYFFLQEKHFETGLCIGLAFLTKFPMGILLVILGLFSILLLPFLAIIAAYGYHKIFKESFSFIVIVFLLFSIPLSVEDPIINEYFSYFEEKQTNGEILVTHPLAGYYAHKNVTIMYYPWFNASQAEYWEEYIKVKNPEYISLDTCEGGFLCSPDDQLCEEKQKSLVHSINESYIIEWQKDLGNCKYFIYKNTKSIAVK